MTTSDRSIEVYTFADGIKYPLDLKLIPSLHLVAGMMDREQMIHGGSVLAMSMAKKAALIGGYAYNRGLASINVALSVYGRGVNTTLFTSTFDVPYPGWPATPPDSPNKIVKK